MMIKITDKIYQLEITDLLEDEDERVYLLIEDYLSISIIKNNILIQNLETFIIPPGAESDYHGYIKIYLPDEIKN
jgi:hypothetical protein